MNEFILHAERLDIRPVAPRAATLVLTNQAAFEESIGLRVIADWWQDTGRHLVSYYAEWSAAPHDFGYGLWLLYERHEQMIIGSAGFKGTPDAQGVIEIGYGVSASFRRRGYAFEAASALVDWAFQQRAVNTVVAECLVENTGSRRILEKLGMQRTGRRDGYLYWKVTRAEFAASRSVT